MCVPISRLSILFYSSVSPLFFFKKNHLFILFTFKRERAQVNEGLRETHEGLKERDRGRERQSHADSAEPEAGIELTNCDIMT